jgi:putative alpha-1,2-mannosidase
MDYPLPYTYRAQNPLNLIIEPQYGTMMQNLVDMYEQSGSIPDFPACNNEASVSDTHYATIVLTDALLKGVRSIKTEKAYEAMRKSILSVPYTKGNYDNDLAAYCLAQVAKKLGKDSDYQLLLKRSANWKKAVDNLDFINNSIPDSDAWYVFSALGFYPSPASDRYVLGIPTFDKIRIGNLTIIVENALKENAGKKKVSFNGKDYPHNYITHEMIEQGGVLEFGITN